MDRIGRERGWPPMTRAAVRGAARRCAARNVVGSPEQVVEKILFQHEMFGHDRFLLQISVGTLPHDAGHAGDRALRHRGRAGRAREVARRGAQALPT